MNDETENSLFGIESDFFPFEKRSNLEFSSSLRNSRISNNPIESQDMFHHDEDFDKTDQSPNSKKRKTKTNKLDHNGRSCSEMSESVVDEGQEAREVINLVPDDTRWKVEEIESLLRNLQKHVPKDDMIPFSLRAKKISWDEVVVDGRSADQCRLQWEKIASKIRKFRVMRDLLNDAQLLLQSQYDSSVKPPAVPRERNHKEKKHPDYPKRPLNPYLIFRTKTIGRLKAKHPKWNLKQLSDRIDEKFRDLSDEKREELNKSYEEEKIRFHSEKKKFYENHPEFLVRPKQKKTIFASQIEDNIQFPKLPRSPLEIFSRQFSDGKNGLTEASAAWVKLPDENRRKFVEEALRDEERYKDELSVLLKQHPHIRPPRFRSRISRVEKLKFSDFSTETATRPGRPMIPQRPYQLFCAEFLNDSMERKRLGSKWMKSASDAWRKLTAMEKKVYENRTNEIWKNYHENAEKYIDSLPVAEQDEERFRLKLGKKNSRSRNPARQKVEQQKQLKKAKRDSSSSGSSSGDASSDDDAALSSAMDGKNLFIYENEREFRCTFPKLTDQKIRDRLGQVFDDLSVEQQEDFEKRASRFEKSFR